MRRAKIVCTIGPASNNREVISELITHGMDVARLNFSHGDYESHKKALTLVREQARGQKKIVSVLQDLQGIKIRVGEVEGGAVTLDAGEELSLYPGKEVSTSKALFISYPALLTDVQEGEKVLLDDGLLQLEVTGKTKDALKAKVIEGGILKSKKGVNLPHSKITLSPFTDKDRKDLAFGISLEVDYVAISFVRTADDILRVREWAKQESAELPPLIAKIEKPEALRNIDQIIEIVDGIMVARGDLGVEMPTEEIPVIQKNLIELANKKGKSVITATQMLESMTTHTRPTRAEATDVANAVLDGSDALMLSAETATGKYPVESVATMDKIISYTEENVSHKIQSGYQIGSRNSEAIADAATDAAQDVGAKAIIVFTHSGFTAKLLSKFKPGVPIIAFTPNEHVLRRLPLFWGTIPFPQQFFSSKSVGKGEVLDSGFMKALEESIISEGLLKKGDTVIFVASSPFLGEPNIMRIHRV